MLSNQTAELSSTPTTSPPCTCRLTGPALPLAAPSSASTGSLNGGVDTVSHDVLDALFNFNERVGWAILRYADGRRDYMPPYVRARQKALKRDEIEMKRRVRSMVRGS